MTQIELKNQLIINDLQMKNNRTNELFLNISVIAAMPLSLELRRYSLYHSIDDIYMPYLSNIVHLIASRYPGISSFNDIPIIEQLLIQLFGSAAVLSYYILTSLPIAGLIYLLLFITGEYLSEKTFDSEK